MSQVKGIYFANGLQAIAKIVSEDEHYVNVENMLGIQLQFVPEDKNHERPLVSFEDMTPYASLEKTGLDVPLVRSSILMFFPVDRMLLEGYTKRTSLIATLN